jgi:hypothetical protein
MTKKNTSTAAPTAPTNGGAARPPASLTKIDAVRQAQAALGRKAKPLAIQKYVKDELGVDISTSVISTYKREIARRAKKSKGGAKARPAPVASVAARETTQKAPAVKKPTAESGGISLKDILVVKELVGRLGAGPLHTLIDAFVR